MDIVPASSSLAASDSKARLLSGQRHQQYRFALLALDVFMKQREFTSLVEGSTTTYAYEKSGILIDLKIAEPQRVAFVTSFPGYTYTNEVVGKAPDGTPIHKVNAKVVKASDVLGAELTVQLIVENHQVIYVPVPKTEQDIARYIVENVLGALSIICEKDEKVRSAFTKKAAPPTVQDAAEILNHASRMIE
jgi:hypothetical protein